MRNRYSKRIFFVFLCLFSLAIHSDARESVEEPRINVAMRMIGHEVLLQSGDSSSLMLPVEKEGERYHIRFGSDIQFFPTELITTTNRAIRETGIASSYRVEVKKTGTDEIAYGYEIANSTANDLLPCGGRIYPKDNYSIFITILDVDGTLDAPNAAALDRLYTSSNNESNYLKIGVLNISLLLLIGSFVFLWKKKNITKEQDPNIIPLGAYRFDKNKMELSLDDKKTELTAKESDLLLLLCDSPNTTLEREQLLKKVWGDEGDYVGRTLDVFISKLRKKLEADASVKIVNIRGVGYKLVMD